MTLGRVNSSKERPFDTEGRSKRPVYSNGYREGGIACDADSREAVGVSRTDGGDDGDGGKKAGEW
ncbi:hypothetical protein TWF703_009264 [Orbilia oligospora]|uniref:Uncharacterized protein n=1 Tax=Orbilia oligospora TaxID=2813651 RepID=A0A7C8NUD6_ORBOL|nr:hypothetical protein TWF703_009264 [Orbilia oligospora]